MEEKVGVLSIGLEDGDDGVRVRLPVPSPR